MLREFYVEMENNINIAKDILNWKFGLPILPKTGLIKKVIYNDPATIVLWVDGTKTVVKANDEPFDPEKGLAMAIAKKALGNRGSYYETFKKWLPRTEDNHETVDAADLMNKAIKIVFDNVSKVFSSD